MTLKNRAGVVIAAILIVGAVIVGGLHYFAEHGQFAPASMTGGSTMSQQRNPAIDGSSGQPSTGGRPVAVSPTPTPNGGVPAPQDTSPPQR